MSPIVGRAAASVGGAATVSGHARRIVQELRRAGEPVALASLGGAAGDLGPLLAELEDAGVVELVGPGGQRTTARAISVLMRSEHRARIGRDVTARLTPAADRVALRVEAGRA